MEISFEQQLKQQAEQLLKFQQQREQNRRLWNIDLETARYLYDLVLEQQPENILEIGSSNGYSTFWLSLAAEIIVASVTSIEVDDNRYQLAQQNLKLRKNIILLKGVAEQIIPTLVLKYDLIFIDAGKTGYINYLKAIEDKISPGALLVADNVISHIATVTDYLDYIRKSDCFATYTVKIGSGLEVSRYNPKT